ncbi:SDR family NAD(P)-dependent oxidoreductase, partial [Ruminococcus sp.]|uniref:SDR family NAD(P)-dependent oxidoreductase n=1 Tax=Ruminococcus sp. TaxID=41978 RepID=UPI003F0174F9
MTDVRGKWALITGASRGIGRLIALEMAKRGCNLVLHSRQCSHCDGLLEQVQALGVQAYAVEAELADAAAVERMLTQIDRAGTRLDIVFNNAGVQVAYRTAFLETPVQDYTSSFAINTIAPMMICYHVLPGMVERGFGRIINTTSGITL